LEYKKIIIFSLFGIGLAISIQARTLFGTPHLLEGSRIYKHGGKKMKKILIAADDTKGSLGVLEVFRNQVRPPEEVILVHVQRILGRSLMGDMLGEAEIATLKESLKDTEFQEELDEKAEKVLSYYKKELENGGLFKIKTVVRAGNVTDEILKVAKEEQVDLMIMGSSGKRGLNRLITGCVTKDVEKVADIPVMVAKAKGCGVKEIPCDASAGLQKVYNAG
jgi:nucleotide-binding universal stress UspA family protein